MKNLNKLKRHRATAIEEAKAFFDTAEAEERDLTPEEETQVEALQTKVEELDKEIRSEEKKVELRQKQEALNASLQPSEPEERSNVGVADNETRSNVQVGENREGLQPFGSFGEQLIAVAQSAITHTTDQRLMRIHEEVRAIGAGEAVPSDGGFLVQKDFSNELFRNVFETGILASRVRRVPITGNSNGIKFNAIDETSRVDGSRWGGIRAYWVDEAASFTASQPKFRKMDLNLQKLTGLFYATDELLEDAGALESIARQGFVEEFGFKLDDSIFNGDGAGKPLGVLQSNALITVAAETGQDANTIEYANIAKMYARLWARSRGNSVWLINQDVLPQLFQLSIPVGTGGVPVFQPANQAAGRPFNTLFGRPILEIEHAETLGTAGDINLVDLSQYVMIEKGGLRQATSIHVQFLTDETVFRFIMRVDGQPVWSSAITPFNGTQTLSPFVNLATRS